MYLIFKLKRKDMKGSELNDEVSECSCNDCVLLCVGVLVGWKVKVTDCIDDVQVDYIK